MPSRSALRIPAALLATAGLVAGLALALLSPVASDAKRGAFPDTIALPDGFQPEGIATGRGTDFFAGSIPTGDIYAGDLRTGRGEILVDAPEGRAAIGLKADRRDRLFVAGGPTGQAYVYDARTGDDLAQYQLTTGLTFVNDVTLTREAAYFTDSQQPVLHVLELGRRGALPDGPTQLPLTGDVEFDNDPSTFELNGIAATPDGNTLLAVQSRNGKLVRIDPDTGDTDEIEIAGGSLVNGDGILLRGRTLYVVRNFDNVIAQVRLDADFEEGRIVRELRDEDFDVPTTIARFGNALYAVNARFGSAPMPETEDDDVVRVELRGGR
ncbi:MAG: hypothetical protein MSC31_07360 [Solirubrobacteraceae bacterium MAG38_C4-C5]|nr:hypothetical protein [Candidatus Siliceabacter maunaloa]